MSAQIAGDPPAAGPGTPRLLLVTTPSPLLLRQQQYLQTRDRLLCRASVSGLRLVTTLFHILSVHAPVPVETGPEAGGQLGISHYACRECRADGREAGEQYPCPTAQEVSWALEAVL